MVAQRTRKAFELQFTHLHTGHFGIYNPRWQVGFCGKWEGESTDAALSFSLVRNRCAKRRFFLLLHEIRGLKGDILHGFRTWVLSKECAFYSAYFSFRGFSPHLVVGFLFSSRKIGSRYHRSF